MARSLIRLSRLSKQVFSGLKDTEPLSSYVNVFVGRVLWQITQLMGGTEFLRYPDGISVAQEAWPTLQRLYPPLIIAKKSRPIWMQSKRMQNF